MAWTLCTSGAAIIKAGVNANADIRISGSFLAAFSDEAEATINSITRRDWKTSPATANFSGALGEVSSNLIAMKIINYDMSGYTSRLEAQTMLDVLRDNTARVLDSIKEDKVKEVMI